MKFNLKEKTIEEKIKPFSVFENNSELKTLVILLGNARGSEIAWNSLYKNVLSVLNADLALCFGQTENKSASLYQKAKYIWEIEEYTNWSDYYQKYFSNNWKKCFLQNANTGFAGGIDNNIGSGSIGLAFRHFIKHNYSDILNKYDRIILTRADHLYLEPHPNLDNNYLWIVEGEDYFGINDRHHVFSSKYLYKMLGAVEFLDSDEGFNQIKSFSLNIELFLLYYFTYNGIFEKIRRFERTFFTVATSTDQTRWAKAQMPVPGFDNLFIKYPTEFKLAISNCKLKA